MRYDHIPRPEIEHHYHIQELIEAQEKRSADRTYHRERVKAADERLTVLQDSKAVCVTDFWCDHCKKDFKSLSIREIQSDWYSTTEYHAFYRSKCRACHAWCIRLITDKHRDSFWFRSKFVALDRGKAFTDTIQPWQTGFNLYYSHKNK